MPKPILLSDDDLWDFSEANGAVEVHRSWRDNMRAQGRPVEEERMTWEGLPLRDKLLDKAVAHDVIQDFIIWYNTHVVEQ